MDFLPTFFDDKTKIWSGPKRGSVHNYDCSVGKIIFSTMKNWPKNICQISHNDGISVTFQEALTWAIRVAQHLKKRGLNCENAIGIIAKNSTYVMPIGVACLFNATPFHAVNPTLDESTVSYIFDITKPTVIFCDGEDYEKVRSATISFSPEIITITNHIDGVPRILDLLEPTKTELFYIPAPLTVGGDQTMAILCSSGTTGMPKAVCISNSALVQDSMLVNSETVIYTSSSLDWLTGLWAFIFSTVFGCTRIITNKPFTPEHFVELVKKYKIDYVVMPPRHLSTLVSSPAATSENLAPIRMLSYGGGLVSKSTLERTLEIIKNAMLNSGYGMTEVGAISINIGIGATNSAGKLVPGVRASIVDENGKNLGYNEVGEICINTGSTWNGYYGNPVESRQMQDSEGWFHTGDLGYFDEKNYLYIVDRKKEILKYAGLHYWPTEIEHVIAEMPQVQDVCVVGIYDERIGDAAGALIVKQKGCQLQAQDVVQYVSDRIGDKHKQLNAGVRFVDHLPQNHNGKTMRKTAKEVFLAKKS